ncbi:MAG TPA: hypothetical protein ENG58_06160 [Thermotogales bacterium]|nr:hypothetical protein [Thermotogales bacterium]
MRFAIADGEDWTTPYGHLEYSGLFYHAYWSLPKYPPSLNNILNCKMVTLSWRRLNPEENLYKFDILRRMLEESKNEGKCLILRLKNHVVMRKSPWIAGDEACIPDWVISKCNPPIVTMKNEDGMIIKVAVPWDECTTKEYLKFMRKFGEQGFLKDPNMCGVYIHGISSSFGEEFWFTRSAKSKLEEKGMTPSSLLKAYEVRLNEWARIAGKDVGKLVWVGSSAYSHFKGYGDVFKKLNLLAERLGMGIRGGALESPHRWMVGVKRAVVYDPESEKIKLNPRFKFNEKNQFGKVRYFGDEIEAIKLIGENRDEIFKSSLFLAKFLGMNFLWVPNDTRFLLRNKEILEWFLKTDGGKSMRREIGIWLREDYVKCGSMMGDRCRRAKCSKVKNIEMGLHQIETVGSHTRPVKGIIRNRLDYMDCVNLSGRRHVDYIARRTDVESGNRRIDLKMKSGFKKNLRERGGMLKITFYDETKAIWTIKTPCNLDFPILENRGTGGLKTVTFFIPPGKFCEDGFEDGTDMKLVVENDENLIVKFVRFILNPKGEIE